MGLGDLQKKSKKDWVHPTPTKGEQPCKHKAHELVK